MNFGFDAKRAYHNATGLGHYSRNLIDALSDVFPEYQYYLFNPKPSTQFGFFRNNIYEVKPRKYIYKLFPSLWRTFGIKNDILKHKIHLYHGLSNEIPFTLLKSGVRTVVTIHDLIFERYPSHYAFTDVLIYRKKCKYACRHADAIIATSRQTREDLVNFYNADEKKIHVCYQHCHPSFGIEVSEEHKQHIRKEYGLPESFFLYVGSIIERKNLLNICRAHAMLSEKKHYPLVVIGDGGSYKKKVKRFLHSQGDEANVIFLSENPEIAKRKGYKTATDFPAIYQMASALLYPSFFEGFGIPVLEALWSKTPVITSRCSSLPEVGGNAAYYVHPDSPEEIKAAMEAVIHHPGEARNKANEGYLQARQFSAENHARCVMNVYQSLM
ncbi:MAG: glycosyltransferase family 4 protein [Chitinophagaceae bacterium]|nr:glycosyltransferase family 4 protein [Chitinophagaceae bacterium]